ncbi:hypothetical protein SBA4_990005 [Candidatus Sulfopaludibacter sp. SbA4]|nr:hypothetical protein SBA4_990005 [Candidatus Sulfopaludibacter sp. SbA4]
MKRFRKFSAKFCDWVFGGVGFGDELAGGWLALCRFYCSCLAVIKLKTLGGIIALPRIDAGKRIKE